MSSTVALRTRFQMTTRTTKYREGDAVSHPDHYNAHPSGIECWNVVRHMSFNLGNAIKYIWRADLKGDAIEDLEKAVAYLQDEVERRKKEALVPKAPPMPPSQ